MPIIITTITSFVQTIFDRTKVFLLSLASNNEHHAVEMRAISIAKYSITSFMGQS